MNTRELKLETPLRLNNGIDVPQLGFGVYEIPEGADGVSVLQEAIRVGYRHIDTASLYGRWQAQRRLRRRSWREDHRHGPRGH